MLAKKTIKNQITLPKAVVTRFSGVDYFDVTTNGGYIVLRPLQESRADEVRARLAQIGMRGRCPRCRLLGASQAMKRRVVLDANTVLSALLFANGRLNWLREHWRTGGCVPLLSRDTARELIRVLAYPKFRLSLADRNELLADVVPYCEVVAVTKKCPVVYRVDRPIISRLGAEWQSRSINKRR